MLVVTLLGFFAWIVTYFVHLFVLLPLPDLLRWAIGAVVALLAPLPAVPFTALLLRPVRRFLLRLRPVAQASLLGRTGVVASPKVDARGGHATFDDGGAGLVLQVRSEIELQRGERIVLVEHVADQHHYRVVRADAVALDFRTTCFRATRRITDDVGNHGPFLIGVAVLLVALLGLAGLFKAFYRKVDQGVALIVNDMSSTPKVHFTGALIIPVLYRAELMRISLITLQIDRRGKEGLICRDNMRADIAVAFYLRVNETQADVPRVAKAIGADRASDKHAVDELFNAKFSEALKTVGKKFDFTELFEKRQEFRDEIIAVIGNDLNGYVARTWRSTIWSRPRSRCWTSSTFSMRRASARSPN